MVMNNDGYNKPGQAPSSTGNKDNDPLKKPASVFGTAPSNPFGSTSGTTAGGSSFAYPPHPTAATTTTASSSLQAAVPPLSTPDTFGSFKPVSNGSTGTSTGLPAPSASSLAFGQPSSTGNMPGLGSNVNKSGVYGAAFKPSTSSSDTASTSTKSGVASSASLFDKPKEPVATSSIFTGSTFSTSAFGTPAVPPGSSSATNAFGSSFKPAEPSFSASKPAGPLKASSLEQSIKAFEPAIKEDNKKPSPPALAEKKPSPPSVSTTEKRDLKREEGKKKNETNNGKEEVVRKSDAVKERKPTTPKAPQPTGPVRHSTRERKPAQQVQVSAPTPASAPSHAIEIPKGLGTRLGDIEHVSKMLQKLPGSDSLLLLAHRLMFGKPGEARTRKVNLRGFCGFGAGSSAEQGVRDKLQRYAVDDLKDLCILLNVERSGTKEELIDRLAKFMQRPSDLGPSKAERIGAKAPKKAAPKKKTTTKKSKPKKADDSNKAEEVKEASEKPKKRATSTTKTLSVPKKLTGTKRKAPGSKKAGKGKEHRAQPEVSEEPMSVDA